MPIKNTFAVIDSPTTYAVTASAGANTSATVTTYTVASHNFSAGQVIMVTGGAPAGINGARRITATTATTVAVAETTNAAVSTAPTLHSICVLDNAKLTLAAGGVVDFRKVESFTRTAPAAGTAGVVTATGNTSTGSQNIVVSQFVKSLGKVVSVTLQYASATTPGANDSANAWKQQLDALPSKYGFNFTYSVSSNVLTITANAPDHFIFLQSVGTNAVTVNNSSTTGVARAGYGADIATEGATIGTPTNYYVRYEFVHGSVDPKGTAGANDYQVQKTTLLVMNTTAASATLSALITAVDSDIQNQMKAIATSGTSIEGIALSPAGQ